MTWKATTKIPIAFAKPIPTADVARFLLDAITDPRWYGASGVQVGGPLTALRPVPTADNSP